MIKKILFSVSIFLSALAYGQRSDGTQPYSFTHAVSTPVSPHVWTVARPDGEIERLQQAVSDDKAFDFGVAVPMSRNLLESTAGQELPDGRRYIRRLIHAPGAFGINLNFTRFEPGRSGTLWVVSADGSTYIGGFDHRSVSPGIPFATAPVKGESVYLEFVYDPKEEGIAVELGEVVYEFMDMFGSSRAFGSSGACNRNVNCPEYADKSDQKRSVAMILTANNVRWCTGALVNNTAEDGKPYFLTARHCNTTPNSIFMFNYESPDCNNIDGPTQQTIQGCAIRVNWYVSDVVLVELSSPPPASYFTYFAGWDARPQPASSTFGIHHPKNDIKKISFDNHPLTSSSYTQGDTSQGYWRIGNWETGTTEPGSSGSPLFNSDKRIVGQLRGGQASCGNGQSDYYGKLVYSWWGEGTPETALRFWLDPANTGLTQMNGGDFNVPDFDYDLMLAGLGGPDSVYCGEIADWTANVRNNGVLPVAGFRVRLFRNGSEVAVREVNQTLSYGNSVSVTFTGLAIEKEMQTFSARVEFLGAQTDENPGNDSAQRNIQRIEGEEVTVTFTYDLFSSETKWGIYQTDGSPVFQSPSAAANEVMQKSFCLPTGCYIFRVTDSGNDGICCAGGQGSFRVAGSDGNVLVANKTFTQLFEVKFCVPGFPPGWENLFEIYPNPSSSQINVKLQGYAEGAEGELLIFGVDGKVLVEKRGSLKYLNTFDVSEWAQGVYFIRVSAGKLKSVQKFVKN